MACGFPTTQQDDGGLAVSVAARGLDPTPLNTHLMHYIVPSCFLVRPQRTLSAPHPRAFGPPELAGFDADSFGGDLVIASAGEAAPDTVAEAGRLAAASDPIHAAPTTGLSTSLLTSREWNQLCVPPSLVPQSPTRPSATSGVMQQLHFLSLLWSSCASRVCYGAVTLHEFVMGGPRLVLGRPRIQSTVEPISFVGKRGSRCSGPPTQVRWGLKIHGRCITSRQINSDRISRGMHCTDWMEVFKTLRSLVHRNALASLA